MAIKLKAQEFDTFIKLPSLMFDYKYNNNNYYVDSEQLMIGIQYDTPLLTDQDISDWQVARLNG